ncbi:hyaluronan mediated motility receptor-like isoform X1 [Palaemon carinicauda]|uniref:hyaluronan mediated motility receptor-like isoform X1 n=1 Tax=Palaemon carinicauda TaxID=392227 RepID=UPI0035B6093C
MFSKAKLKRFNEEVGCAPPPTAYNPKLVKGATAAVTLDKSDRWHSSKEVTPGPGAYTGQLVNPPSKNGHTSSNKLNLSSCSSSSTVSGGGTFLSPQKPARLVRSRSMRSVQPQKDENSKVTDLEKQIKTLSDERDDLKQRISQLENQLEELQKRISVEDDRQKNSNSNVSQEQKEKYELELKSARFTLDDNEAQMESLNDTITHLTCQNEHLRSMLESGCKTPKEEMELHKQMEMITSELLESRHIICVLKDERSGLQLKLKELEEFAEKKSMNEDELQGLKDHLEHLTVLRDNLEATARAKDDLIAELHVQLDEVVVEGRSYHQQMELYRSRMEQLEDELQNSFIDRDETENKVRSLVAKYEGLMKDQIEEREIHREILAKKDIEIELLNASLSNLSLKASEYESTITVLQEEKKDRLSKISVLETTISDLSMKTQEKEMMESMLDEELNHRTDEVTKLEDNLREFDKKLQEIRREKESVEAKLEVEKKNTEELNDRINTLEVQIKEKEVVQQFLEKEISSREAELSQRLDEASVLHERVQAELDSRLKMEEDLANSEKKVSELDKELASVKETLMSRDESLACVENKMALLEDNNSQLEEKVVELMAEISDREAQHIIKMKNIESDIGVKYSESLLEHEATRRVLSQTLEDMEKEKLLRMAAESDIESLREELSKMKEEKEMLEHNIKDLVQKYTSLEDALECEEAENRDLEERLEREVHQAKEAAAVAQKELSSLKTSMEGFCTQITQLKIDMRKKSQAVDEMQQCIDALREEKQHLTTLRDNLEKTLEAKEDTIASLNLQASTLEREMEEERVTLRSRIGDLENHLKETQKENELQKKRAKEIEEKLSSVEEENLHLNQSYKKQLEEKTLAETRANAKLEALSNKYDGYEDQVNNLQTSLMEKTKEYDALQEKYTAATSTTEEMKVLETSVKRFRREIEAMNKTLASKDSSLETLTMTLESKSEEVQSLYKTLEEKQTALLASEGRVQHLEEVEEKLTKEKDALSVSLSAVQDELGEVKLQVSRIEITFNEEKSVEINQLKSSLEELNSTNQSLQEEADSWKNKFHSLENMIEPFRAQLDAYEVEKASLLSRSSADKEEVDKLSKQYATLLGHQNHKQKIQHVLKLKTENNQLREDVYKLRQETDRQRKTIKRMEDKMLKLSGSTTRLNETTRSIDKENSFYLGMGNQVQSSTPLKPSNKPHRI